MTVDDDTRIRPSFDCIIESVSVVAEYTVLRRATGRGLPVGPRRNGDYGCPSPEGVVIEQLLEDW